MAAPSVHAIAVKVCKLTAQLQACSLWDCRHASCCLPCSSTWQGSKTLHQHLQALLLSSISLPACCKTYALLKLSCLRQHAEPSSVQVSVRFQQTATSVHASLDNLETHMESGCLMRALSTSADVHATADLFNTMQADAWEPMELVSSCLGPLCRHACFCMLSAGACRAHGGCWTSSNAAEQLRSPSP